MGDIARRDPTDRSGATDESAATWTIRGEYPDDPVLRGITADQG